MKILSIIWRTISIIIIINFCFERLVFQFFKRFVKFRINFLSFLTNSIFTINLSIKYDGKFFYISILAIFSFVTNWITLNNNIIVYFNSKIDFQLIFSYFLYNNFVLYNQIDCNYNKSVFFFVYKTFKFIDFIWKLITIDNIIRLYF